VTDIASLGIKVTTEGVAQAQADLDKLAASGNKAAASTDKLAQANANAAKKYASPQYRQQADDLAKLIGQIDPTVAALDRLDKQQAKLSAFRKSGLLGADDFKTYSAAIDEARGKITSASGAVHEFSLNNSFARRELGRLASDIANGNWGRFEQTAATLANSSGLLGMAFTAAGAAIAGVVAVVGLFVAAAYKGWAENEKLRVSLIATGNAAGQNAASLNDMAVAVGRSTGHWGEAREAVEAFAASGRVAGAGMAGLAKSAVDAASVTGQSIGKIVAQFEELQRTPAESVAKLNEQYHFLTSAQYAQIAALEEEGRTRDASRLAEVSYTAAMAERAKEVDSNAGWIIRSAHAVRDAWNEAWNSLKGVGVPQTLADQARNLQAQIDSLSRVRVDRQGNLVQGANGEEIAKLKKQLDDVRRQQVQGAFADSEKALQAGLNEDAIAAQKRLSAFASPADVRDNAIKKANADRLAALYGVVDPAERAKIEAQAKKQIDDANKAYASATKPRGSIMDEAIGNNPRADLTASIQKEIDGFKKEADQWARSTTAAAAYKQTLQDMLETRQRAIDLQVAAIGMGQREAQQQSALIAIDEDYNRKKADLQKRQQNATSELDRAGYQQQLDDLAKYHNDRIRMEVDGWQRAEEARKSAALGARAATRDFIDDAGNVAAQTHDVFVNAFGGMADALANFVTTGKLNFKGLVTSILSDLAKMEARILASQILQSIVGSFGGYGGTNGNGGVTYNSQGFVNHVYANGGVVDGSANLSAFSGQVVDRPTLFAFAKGNGLMGEAGPEAILPLRRGPDGKLGVASSSGGGDFNLSQTFVLDGSGSTGQQAGNSASDDNLRKFAQKMKSVAQQTILEEQRPGGSLWTMRQPA
jgi:lambda family phage tail tape measure protein